MRKPTPEEEPYADWIAEIEDLGKVYIVDISVLTNDIFASMNEPKFKSVMMLRRGKPKMIEELGHKNIFAHCDYDDEQALRFLLFLDFVEQRRDDQHVYLRRASEPYA